MSASNMPAFPTLPDTLGLPVGHSRPERPSKIESWKANRPVRSHRVENARLRWQEDGRPFASEYGDVFFTRGDEVAESQYVFITANRLQERWEEMAGKAGCFVIGELGFGCSLNFLNTWQAWLEFKNRNPASQLRLHYISVEKHPLRRADLERVFSLWPQLQELSSQLLNIYPDHSTGCHRLWPQQDITLDIHYGDARLILPQFASDKNFSVDCWYADGFSPNTNPDLWHGELFRTLAECSAPGATLSTYSAAGSVRRALQDCNFQVEKSAGFGKKRHMLRAWLGEAERSRKTPADEHHITVVGAGLAGCTLAHSLARRGWRVTIIEAANELLNGASGSGQLNLRCHLIAEVNPLATFYLQAFLFARQQFESLTRQQAQGEKFWQPTGLVQLDSALKPGTESALTEYKDRLSSLYDEAVLTPAEADRLSAVAGIRVQENGVLFPLGGWVDPQGLIRAYLQHPGITLLTGTTVATFDYRQNPGSSAGNGHWLCYGEDRQVLSESPYLALCTAAPMVSWELTRSLPLQTVRGQNTFISHPQLTRQLQTVVCGTRTVFPAHGDSHTVSASYQRDNVSMQRNEQEDRESLSLLKTEISDPDVANASIIGARVAVRYNSVDHAPIVGPLPDREATIRNCEHNKPRPGELPGRLAYHRGLYVSTAHASSGLATCALAGETLASMICNEPLPISPEVAQQLSPTRFLLRDLRKRFL